MKTLSLHGKTIRYQDIGTGFPLLFGHSYLWNANMWAPQVETLSSRYRCIVPELLSHGGSSLLGNDSYSIEEMAKDHADFMQALGISRYSIVGLSVGGMWGIELALTHPERVATLCVLDSYAGEEPEITRTRYLALIDTIASQGFTLPLTAAVVPLFFSQYASPALVAQFTELLHSYTQEQLPGIAAIGRSIFKRKSNLECLKELNIPVLFMTGEHDTPRPPQETLHMHKQVKGSTLAIIPKAGHISALEQPEYVTKELEGFLEYALQKVEEPVA